MKITTNHAKLSLAQFDLLFHENYEDLCLTAVKYVKDPALAQDLVQEFFVYFWTKRDTIILTSSFKAYAVRAVTNISVTYLKRKKNHVIYQDELPDLDFDPAHLLSEELAKSTKVAKLIQVIKELPPERKKLFLMSNVLGLTYAEIAAKNNISINTVKTQIKKAYAYLRANMGDIISLFF